MKYSFLLSLLLTFLLCKSVKAQEVYNFKGTGTVKANLFVLGAVEKYAGASFQKYLDQYTSIQYDAETLWMHSRESEYVFRKDGYGARLGVEFRRYRRRRLKQSASSFYSGYAFVTKYVHLDASKWMNIWTSSTLYQQYYAAQYHNIALGITYRFGWEGYLDRDKRILLDVSMAYGLMNNFVLEKPSTDPLPYNYRYNFESYNNMRSGISFLAEYKIALGYRFDFRKKK